jgi:hypothetical protein
MRTADCDRIVVVKARIRLERIDQGCLDATGERREIGEQHTPDRELSWLTVAMTAAATRSQFVGRKSERYTDAEKIIVQWKYPQWLCFMRKWYSCLASTSYRRGFKSSRCAEHET